MKDDPKSLSFVRSRLRVDSSPKYLLDFQQIDLSASELYKINEVLQFWINFLLILQLQIASVYKIIILWVVNL